MGINEFEPQAAEPIGTNGESRDQPFTLREPLHAVRQGKQIAGAVRQPHQHARAQPQHHQAVGVRGQEEAQTEQDPGGHGHTLNAKAFLQLSGDRRGERQPEAQQAKGESHLADRLAQFVRQRTIKQAPGIDRTESKLGDDGAD